MDATSKRYALTVGNEASTHAQSARFRAARVMLAAHAMRVSTCCCFLLHCAVFVRTVAVFLLCGDRSKNEACSSCSAASGPVRLFTGPG